MKSLINLLSIEYKPERAQYILAFGENKRIIIDNHLIEEPVEFEINLSDVLEHKVLTSEEE